MNTNAYAIKPFQIDNHVYVPGERVILTEWLNGPGSETHVFTGTFAGTVEATLGEMIVVHDDSIGEDVVLAADDLVAIDPC